MQVVTTVAEIWAARRAVTGRLGLVPTMGALHTGHLSLVACARAEADSVWVTVFVNPLQFGPREDLASYPRDLAGDMAKLQSAGVDLVFAPDTSVMYPPGFSSHVDVSGVSEGLEGARRPGHFAGVATVMTKLFVLTRPDVAVFGQKDAQQLRVIRRLTADLAFDLRIIGAPTVREADGLALSSRNAYLSPAERQAAPVLRRALATAERAHAAGERDGDRLRAAIQSVLAAEPLARVDYVSIADEATLQELATVTGPALASLAVWIGATRLIDNVVLGVTARSLPEDRAGSALEPARTDRGGTHMPSLLGEMLRHNTWATLRLLDFCAALSDEQFTAAAVGTYGRLSDTLLHLVAAEERYLGLLSGTPVADAVREQDAFPGIATLREHAERSGAGIAAAAEQAEPGQILRGVRRGEAYAMPVAVPLIQTINHATEHRAHVMTILTQLGLQPPEIDGWNYWQAELGG